MGIYCSERTQEQEWSLGRICIGVIAPSMPALPFPFRGDSLMMQCSFAAPSHSPVRTDETRDAATYKVNPPLAFLLRSTLRSLPVSTVRCRTNSPLMRSQVVRKIRAQPQAHHSPTKPNEKHNCLRTQPLLCTLTKPTPTCLPQINSNCKAL